MVLARMADAGDHAALTGLTDVDRVVAMMLAVLLLVGVLPGVLQEVLLEVPQEVLLMANKMAVILEVASAVPSNVVQGEEHHVDREVMARLKKPRTVAMLEDMAMAMAMLAVTLELDRAGQEAMVDKVADLKEPEGEKTVDMVLQVEVEVEVRVDKAQARTVQDLTGDVKVAVAQVVVVREVALVERARTVRVVVRDAAEVAVAREVQELAVLQTQAQAWPTELTDFGQLNKSYLGCSCEGQTRCQTCVDFSTNFLLNRYEV